MPIMRPAADLQRNINEIYELCESSSEPVYITKNGRAKLVVMDVETYETRMSLERRVYEREMRVAEGIRKGWEEIKRGEYVTLDEIIAEDERLGLI
jgi:prevent-host-death family protein